MNILDEMWVGRSAGRQIDRAGTRYRFISTYLIYDKACMYNQDER